MSSVPELIHGFWSMTILCLSHHNFLISLTVSCEVLCQMFFESTKKLQHLVLSHKQTNKGQYPEFCSTSSTIERRHVLSDICYFSLLDSALSVVVCFLLLVGPELFVPLTDSSSGGWTQHSWDIFFMEDLCGRMWRGCYMEPVKWTSTVGWTCDCSPSSILCS